MSCKNYRKALMDAAATNAAPSRELRSHLNACASCRAAFTEELQLFAAIDTGLQAAANAEVPASLFPRVRAKLNERVAPRRTYIPAVAALAAATVIVATIVFLRSATRGTAQEEPQITVAVRSVAPSEAKALPPSVPRTGTSAPVPKDKERRFVRNAPAARGLGEDVQVLIPSGQKRAIDALLVSVMQGVVKPDVLLAEKPKKPLRELEVSPIEISPVEMRPLDEVGQDSSLEKVKAER
ncbi:MAG: anti-sigma factor family protein [Candidatus Acidiferrales bacterium]